MKKEYLDVVNSKNRVIGGALKSKYEKEGLRHRASHLFILNNKGKIFLQLRPKWKIHSPNRYDYSVGEHVSSGETYEEALERGLLEELDIKYSGPIYFLTEYHIYGKRPGFINREIAHCFLIHYDKKIKIKTKELSGGRWFNLKEIGNFIKKDKLGLSCQKTIQDYIRFRKKLDRQYKVFINSKFAFQVIKKGKITYSSRQKGIKSIIQFLRNKAEILENSIIFDKVVGRAAALLLVYARVFEVYAALGSREAARVFKKHKVYYKFKRTVTRILNKDKTDSCPFEKLAYGKSSEKFFKLIKDKL